MELGSSRLLGSHKIASKDEFTDVIFQHNFFTISERINRFKSLPVLSILKHTIDVQFLNYHFILNSKSMSRFSTNLKVDVNSTNATFSNSIHKSLVRLTSY